MKIKIKNKTLRKIGEIADREGYNVFVVGGYVRDLLLGKESADIDIMITGEGIKFAELVANEYDKKPDAIYKILKLRC
jgi:tRNA nucleotidyltransferase (CCA-adding enzyme)